MLFRSLEQEIYEIEEGRKAKIEKIAKANEEGFKMLEKHHDRLTWTSPPPYECNTIFNLHGNASLLTIFLKIFSPQFLTQLIQSVDPTQLTIDKKRAKALHLTHKLIYGTFAVIIRIQGIHNAPKRNTQNYHPLKEAVEEARTHFSELHPLFRNFGINHILKVIALGLLSGNISDALSLQFQDLVKHVGEYVAGDEKLLHFTGNSGDIRKVVSKPDRVGLWFYQLCVKLSNKTSYLLYFKLHHSDEARGESIPVSSIVKTWGEIVKRKSDGKALLAMDSYYLDNAGRTWLRENKINYVASVTKERFPGLCNKLIDKVEKPGQWEGLHNSETGESFVYHWDTEKNAGKKFVISNAFKLHYERYKTNIIPLYDHYKLTFKACDTFNAGLHDRTWPHKHGGRDAHGDLGLQSNFAMSCALQNVFNCYCDYNKIGSGNYDFRELCIRLADELFGYCCQITN
jgi:hypothetical protein